MKTDRRSFLKIGGVFVLGLGSLPVVRASAENHQKNQLSGEVLAKKKWALIIDLRQCWEQQASGCAGCIQACNRIHNIPAILDRQEEVKWVWSVPYNKVFPEQNHEYLEKSIQEQPCLVLCNHCENPPCVRVCPTKATFKRADGIVMMDYHRCIGCRYCMAACPYGARSFNFQDPRPLIKELNTEYPTREKGVVEKCNFCAERLAEGISPACVEACRPGALIFGDLQDPESEVRKILGSRHALRRKPELGTGPQVFYVL